MGPDRVFSRVGIALLSCWLSACSIYTLPGSEPAPVEDRPSPVESPGASTPPAPAPRAPARVPEPEATAAYTPLIERARAATERGDYEEALALLERAQRIDPDSAAVYLAMARTHDARGDRVRARATAERGLLYCRDPAQCEQLRGYTR